MRVGTLEIQLLAGMARLQKDMNDAQRIVGGAMGNVERSVASARRAMQTLGVGLPIAAITDQVRRMTDQYTKLDAQIRIATKSQAAYAQGLSDIRRISSIAQADISATSMLYTRLMNVMDGTGVSQQKLATVTETVSFGLKAYGATTQEAASAALQLSQAMGANRLGGEEFRAVMEAMPNVMKVLADSMGVPLGELRALSIAGKITADEMVKAFGNPAIAAQFKALAESTQTVTGAWQVARNELMLLVGEFSKSSGLTSSTIAAFNAFGAVFRFAADNMGVLTNALLAYATVMAGKLVVGLAQARLAQMAANVAAAEAAIANVAVAESAVFAAKANLAGAAAAARAGGSMAVASIAAKEYAASVAALAAAEKAQEASSIGIMGRIKGLAGRAGWIGMALFGAWTVYDFLNGMQQVADGADKLKNKFEGLSLAEVQMARQRELIRQIGMRGMFQDDAAIQNSQDMIRAYDQQIAKMVELQNAETAAQRVKQTGLQFSHDEQVIIERYNELLKQKNDLKLTEAEFAARVADIYGVGAKALKANAKELKLVSDLERERIGVLQDHMKGVGDTTQTLLGQVAAQEDELARMGLTEAQLVALTKARYDEQIAIAEKRKVSAGVNEAEIVLLNEQIRQLEKLKRLAGDKLQKREELRAVAEQRKAYEDMWKSIEGVAHETWTRVWTEGRDAFTNIGKTIKSAILDLLYQMTVKKWIIGVSASMSGGAASAADMSSSIGGGGGFNIPGLDFGGSALTTLGNAIGSSVVSGLGTGMSLGWTAATEAASAYSAAGMAVEGFALQLGAAMPYIGAALAVASLLGGSKGVPTQSTSDVTQTYLGGTRTGQTTGRFGGTGGADTLDQLATSIAELTTAFGGKAGRQSLFFGSNTGGLGNNYTPEFLLAGAGYNSTTANAGANLSMTPELVARESARVMVSALQRSDLPKYLKEFFNTLTPAKMTQEDVTNALAYAQALKQTRDALTETRTPLEILRANVADISKQLKTSAATYKTDFVKAIDKGLTPETFAKWTQAGQMLDALAQAEAQAAADRLAATQALQQAWQGLTDAIFAEVARIRGLTATPSATMAQFATLTAMARAGDQDAAKLLPGVARAVLDTAALTASNATDLARIQGRTAASLEGTGNTLASKYGLTIPAYASGGTHAGGLRLVGENGPELEYTGPSTIFNNRDTRGMLDNSGVVASVDALRAELRAIGIAVSGATQKTAKILDRWDGEGMPEVREAV